MANQWHTQWETLQATQNHTRQDMIYHLLSGPAFAMRLLLIFKREKLESRIESSFLFEGKVKVISDEFFSVVYILL